MHVTSIGTEQAACAGVECVRVLAAFRALAFRAAWGRTALLSSHILGQVERQGFTLVPLRVYFKGRNAKVDLGLARGKKEYDKRDDIAKRESKREIERLMKSRGRE